MIRGPRRADRSEDSLGTSYVGKGVDGRGVGGRPYIGVGFFDLVHGDVDKDPVDRGRL